MAPQETDSSKAALSQQQQQDEQQERPIQVSVNSSAAGIARAVLYRLQHAGRAEVWASSAANHFTAISALAQAQAQLLEQPLLMEEPGGAADGGTPAPGAAGQQPWERWCHGLVASATLTSHDQPTKDAQKRRLLKLTLCVEPAPELDAGLLRPGQPGSLSSNRTKGVPEVLALMQEQLLQPQHGDGAGSGSGGVSVVRPGGCVVVEARGEQAATRALKAALSLQAAAGVPLLLRPVAGKVVDVVAEKRGQALLADGLRLVWTWAAA